MTPSIKLILLNAPPEHLTEDAKTLIGTSWPEKPLAIHYLELLDKGIDAKWFSRGLQLYLEELLDSQVIIEQTTHQKLAERARLLWGPADTPSEESASD